MIDRDSVILVTGSSNPKLAEKIGLHMNPPVEVHNGIDKVFPDGETRVQIPVNVRNRSVYIVQSTCPPNPDKAYMELFQLVTAARGASNIPPVVIEPYMAYGRQDRKDRPRTAVTGAMNPKILEFLGAGRIMTIDIHAEATEGSTLIPWDKLPGSYTLGPAVKALDLPDPIIGSTDIGGYKRATLFSEAVGLGANIANAIKERNADNKSRIIDMNGVVHNRDLVLIDDMADTLGTMADAADFAVARRGARSVHAVATHGLFSGDALKRLSDSAIKEILVTDTVRHRDEVLVHPKVRVFSVAEHLARAIEYNLEGKSISADLI